MVGQVIWNILDFRLLLFCYDYDKIASHFLLQMTVRFTLWDCLKILKEQMDTQINNLASLLTHLLATKAVSLSVFKVMKFESYSGANSNYDMKCSPMCTSQE